MSELTSTTGIVAVLAAGGALAALVWNVVLMAKVRRLRNGQEVVLGKSEKRDLVAQAAHLQALVEDVEVAGGRREAETLTRLESVERRLDHSLSHASVIRYDAYDEMSGRQSSSIAILDDHADGILVSSILHREQARVYAKRVCRGESELGISPEERVAIDAAMDRDGGVTAAAED